MKIDQNHKIITLFNQCFMDLRDKKNLILIDIVSCATVTGVVVSFFLFKNFSSLTFHYLFDDNSVLIRCIIKQN